MGSGTAEWAWVRCGAGGFVALSLAGACSSTEARQAPKDPVAACGQYESTLCAAQAHCGSTLSPGECRQDLLTQGLDCQRAIHVSSSFDQCIAETKAQSCSVASTPVSCNNLITVGAAPAVVGKLSACFAPTPVAKTCDAYCASVGQACTPSCAIFQGVPPIFGGIDWDSAGVCPASDKGLAVPDCSLDLGLEARCCCVGGAGGGAGGATASGGAGGGDSASGGTAGIFGTAGAGGTPGASPDAGCAAAPSSGNPGPCNFTFDVTTVSAKGQFSPANVGAIWVTDSQGSFVKTLVVWGTTRLSSATAWTTAGGTTVDAVTGATRQTHGPLHSTWDCTDTSKQPVPGGQYSVHVTFAEDNTVPFFSPPPHEASVSFPRGCPADLAAPDTPNFVGMHVTLR